MISFQDNDIKAIWEEVFNIDAYRMKIAEIHDRYPDEKSVNVQYNDIDGVNPDFAMYLLDKPDRCIKIGEETIKERLSSDWNPTDYVNLRIKDLPKDAKVEVRDLRSKHLGKLVAVEGLVRKATLPKLRMTNAFFECSKCGEKQAIRQRGMFITEPVACKTDACNKSALRFSLLEEECQYINTQKIEIQENPEGLRGGAQPERLTGLIEDDVAGIVTPGNRITMNGIIRPVEKGDRDKTTVFDIYMDIQSVEFTQHEYDEIEITEEDEIEIKKMAADPQFFDKLVKSISPTIFGMDKEKEAVALQLFGGTHKEMDDGSKIRGDIHVLLMGDPGVAKSQLLGYMSRLAPRGIYASGKSASAAGLCVDGQTELVFHDGNREKIADFVMHRMNAPEEYKPGIWRQKAEDACLVQSIGDLGSVRYLPITYVWKIKTPDKLYKVKAGDCTLILTPETKIQAMSGAKYDWVEARNLKIGDFATVVKTNMRMMPISEIEILTDDLPEFVYDLTIEPSHAFIGNGFVIHNTAAAVKDDFGEGRWTLEAGALVLADRGLACIDELDKMTEQDRSSLHEAMESQRISIAKAGITATLQSRCSLLAAANPKFGRFDMSEKIVGQIDLPPALMSRFDLIFVMTDKPQRERDANITDHILKAHRRGEVRGLKESVVGSVDKEQILTETNIIAPVYSEEIIRKYVSYAKKNCNPVMSEEAVKKIEKAYLDIRVLGEKEGESVPITARQLEAYVRLSEATAKSRLSPVVEAQDADRAINLIGYYLDKIASNSSGGMDVDNFTSNWTQKERKNRKMFRDEIISLIKQSPTPLKVSELKRMAVDNGINESVVDNMIENMKRGSEIIVQSDGGIKLV